MIKFSVVLGEDDWDANRGAWRCEALKIPSAHVEAIYSNGATEDFRNYQTKKSSGIIVWAGEMVEKISVQIVLKEELAPMVESNQRTKVAVRKTGFYSVLFTVLISVVVPVSIALIDNGSAYAEFFTHLYSPNAQKLDVKELGLNAQFLNEEGRWIPLKLAEIQEIAELERSRNNCDKIFNLAFDLSKYQDSGNSKFRFSINQQTSDSLEFVVHPAGWLRSNQGRWLTSNTFPGELNLTYNNYYTCE